MEKINISQLPLRQTFYLTKRKYAKAYRAEIIEKVERHGPWESAINSNPEIEGKYFLMGMCGTRFQGQLMLPPNTDVYIK